MIPGRVPIFNSLKYCIMKAEITMSQLWWNPSILGFFFTNQAARTLEQLMDRAEDSQTALEQIEDYANACDMDADEIGDLFHDMDVDELAAEIGIELEEEEGEGEED